MSRRKISGSRTIVTGASSGIGRALALELARQGARSVLTARRAELLEELQGQVRQVGGEAHVVAGDIVEAEVRQRLLETARSELGGLDLLINNAGVGAIGPFAEASEERLRRVMEVNFFAPAELIRCAVPLLRDGNRPMIVNVSSVLGHRAVPKKSEYCASKFALHGLSDSIRAELASCGIDVLVVSPATTATEFFDNVLEKNADLPWLALGAMSPEAVARKAVKAMRRGRQEIILTPGGKALVWCDRLCPPLVNRLVARFG
ncbi:MAG TPA: SDR family NAD(P)-dependent oxidoreductase [Candidatus Anammoximicrobium sp.]|nr:SDR family NAD(P)-dependent oxidoreductase [Candidatus Anammoximicrobium sp.]